jgi:hypothetical protein
MILTNITKCEKYVFGKRDDRSEFACFHIVKHDQACTYADKSFWTWVNNFIANLISNEQT